MAYEVVSDLIKAFREDEKDDVAPYFWGDDQLVRFANGALTAFAERTLSVVDDGVEVSFSAGEDVLPYPEYIIDVINAQLVIGEKDWPLDVAAPADVRVRVNAFAGRPATLIANNATGSMRLVPKPKEAGSVRLQVIRRPVKELSKDSKLVDLNRAHREYLLLFIKHRAYNVHDAEVFDPVKSAGYLNEFNYECQRIYEAELLRRSGARTIKPARW